MPIVIDPEDASPAPWNPSALDVITGAMQLCQAIGVGERVKASDIEVCMNALEGIVRELSIYGVTWPKVSSAPVSIEWDPLSPDRFTPPEDYFGVPVLKYLDAGDFARQLGQLTKVQYELLDATQTAEHPTHFYVAPNFTFMLWPVPTQDPTLTLTYQSIAINAVISDTPVAYKAYLNGLQYLLADEISLKYGVPQDIRVEIGARATQKRVLMVQWATESAPMFITVDD
jgi:hypothetical protein